MLTEEQKIEMDAVFNEPLSDRSGGKVPEDYKPPEMKDGEDLSDYLTRVAAYDNEYFRSKK